MVLRILVKSEDDSIIKTRYAWQIKSWDLLECVNCIRKSYFDRASFLKEILFRHNTYEFRKTFGYYYLEKAKISKILYNANPCTIFLKRFFQQHFFLLDVIKNFF